jgi:hypothetical protein
MFRQAKLTDTPLPPRTTHLHALCLLHTRNYSPQSLTHLSSHDPLSYISQHLGKCGCPLFGTRIEESGRKILMALGWVMAVSDYFGRVRDLIGVEVGSGVGDGVGGKGVGMGKYGVKEEIEQTDDILEMVRESNRKVSQTFKQTQRLLKAKLQLHKKL